MKAYATTSADPSAFLDAAPPHRPTSAAGARSMQKMPRAPGSIRTRGVGRVRMHDGNPFHAEGLSVIARDGASTPSGNRMNEWILEHPVPLAVVLVALGAFALWRAASDRNRRVLFAGVGLIAAAGVVLAAGSFVTTPGEHAERTTRALVDRAVAGDVDGAMQTFTADAVLNYGSREAPSVSVRDIRAALESLRGRNRIESNRITDLDFSTLDDATGEVELSCSTSVVGSDGAIPTRWILRVRRDGDAWRIDRLTFRSLLGRPPTPGIWR
jgi:hypothetical protein